jgi:uncharacterized protein (TIGR00730 family)
MTESPKRDPQKTGYGETYTFLEGPHSRISELWFAIKVFFEFIRGFRKLHWVGPCITIFGSARFAPGHPSYELARETASQMAKLGFSIMTGGGPGIMEAANRGAKEAGGRSVGSNIVLEHEQDANEYLDTWFTFRYFFVRKVLLLKYSYAFIVMPGGAGTMDELFETLTLVQTKSIKNFPIVVMDKEFWQPLMDLLQSMVDKGTISPGDLDLIKMTDSPEEAVAHIKDHLIDNNAFGLIKRLR